MSEIENPTPRIKRGSPSLSPIISLIAGISTIGKLGNGATERPTARSCPVHSVMKLVEGSTCRAALPNTPTPNSPLVI